MGSPAKRTLVCEASREFGQRAYVVLVVSSLLSSSRLSCLLLRVFWYPLMLVLLAFSWVLCRRRIFVLPVSFAPWRRAFGEASPDRSVGDARSMDLC